MPAKKLKEFLNSQNTKYVMEVYVAHNLASEPGIAFNAGTHTEIIKLSYQDFDKLVKPKLLSCPT